MEREWMKEYPNPDQSATITEHHGTSRWRLPSLLFVILAICLVSPTVEATETFPSGELVLVTTGSTLLAGGLTLVVVSAVDDPVAARGYVRRNALAIRADINFGAGETVEDLAELFDLPDKRLADFGRRLRERRHTLGDLLKPDHIAADGGKAFVWAVDRLVVDEMRREAYGVDG